MISVRCVCGKELNTAGAIILSPPVTTDRGRSKVTKIHICNDCWPKVDAFLSALAK